MLWPDPQVSIDNALKTSAPDVPATFGDTFDAAWHEGQLFSSTIASGNAQMAGLDSYIDEVNQKSGTNIRRDVYGRLDMQTAAQEAVAKIRQQQPDVQIPDLTDDELNKRAVAASSEAHQAYTAMAGREKTFAGKAGMVLGGLASGTVDPVNLVGLAVAPEAEVGVLGSAAVWGGYGAGSQAINEVANAPFRNQVQPGYSESGQPGMNIVESTIGGAALGGTFKALGNVWQRMKTGEWPRSVRDAGNIVESEANIQQSNILPGVEGEADHQQALSGAIDDIATGRPTDARRGSFLAAYDQKLNPVMDALSDVKGARNAVTMERAAAERVENPELPFAQTEKMKAEEGSMDALAGRVRDLAKSVGEDMAPGQDVTMANYLSRLDHDQATAVLDEFMLRPRTLPETLPSASDVAKAERMPVPEPGITTPESRAATFAEPGHDVALNTQLEQLRDTSERPQMIPVGVDENGEPQYRLLDEAIQDAANDRDAADQIEACINPPVETEE